LRAPHIASAFDERSDKNSSIVNLRGIVDTEGAQR
jgi:hypothetical protein